MSGKKGKNERSDEEVEEDHTKNVEKFEKEEVRGGGRTIAERRKTASASEKEWGGKDRMY